MYISLELAKKHLNIESGYTDDDSYITTLIDVAEKAVLKHCNEDVDVLMQEGDGEMPTPLKNAMLLFLGHMYQNREIVATKTAELPLAYEYLIALYQNYDR